MVSAALLTSTAIVVVVVVVVVEATATATAVVVVANVVAVVGTQPLFNFRLLLLVLL